MVGWLKILVTFSSRTSSLVFAQMSILIVECCLFVVGVVHANVGQKLLNCYPLRVFSSDR